MSDEPTIPLPSHDPLFSAIGGALSNWSIVELNLASLFEAISDIPDDNKAAALFATIISFETRLAVCDRLMQMESISDLENEMWTKLSGKLSKSYKKRRHPIAHFSTTWTQDGEPVATPFLTMDKIYRDDLASLRLTDVRESSRNFILLYKALQWFRHCAFRRRSKQSGAALPDLEEPPLVLQLRELATLSLEERKRQQKPRSG